MKTEKLHTEFFGKEYYKNLCKNLGLPKDFLKLDELDYMFLELKLLYRLYGDSIDEEKLKEQVLNELQSLGLRITKKED